MPPGWSARTGKRMMEDAAAHGVGATEPGPADPREGWVRVSENTERTGAPPARPAGGPRTARQRRPTGAPPPLPHPFTVSTTAWLLLAAVDRGLRFPVFGAARPGAGSMIGPTPGCCASWRRCGRLADRCGQRDQGGRHRLGGHGAGAVGSGADHGLPALAAPAGLPGQPVLPGDRRAVDLLRPVPAASLRRAHHRQLGRVLGAVSAGRRAHDLPHGRGVLPGRAGPPARLRQGRGGRDHRRVLPGPAVPGRRSPRRRALRRGPRGRDTGHGVPLLHPERDIPRRVPPGPDRSRRRRRPARRGDQAGRARPARADRARDQARRPGIVGRLDAAAAARRRGPGRVPVREAVHQGPRPRRPLVQAVADDPLRLPGRRASLPDRAAAGPVRGLRPAPAARRRDPHGQAVRDRGDHPRARVHDRHRVLRRRGRDRRAPTSTTR